MQVEQRKLNTVFPYINNPRMNEQTVQKCAASIKAYGFRQPIVVDRDSVVIVGHTRLAAATLLGLDVVPVHVADNLTPAQAKAYRIADNRIAEDSSWDMELLPIELEQLLEMQVDLTEVGFDEDEFKRIMAGNDENKTDDDESSRSQRTVVCPECGHEF